VSTSKIRPNGSFCAPHHDPLLKLIEQVWKTNPLRTVIPVDWAGIAWALRTVWLRSFTRPDVLQDFSELNAAIWLSALDIWSVAGRRWCGQVSPDRTEAANSGDRRFAAPEWHSNALYRTLREVYLLASNWPLKHGEVTDMCDAERLRLNFHLRQFVDAMSPALLLALNPVALRRAFDRGPEVVRTGLPAGAKEIRTAGPTSEPHPAPNRTGRH
jgi:polyhydroxyalkanoate synthase